MSRPSLARPLAAVLLLVLAAAPLRAQQRVPAGYDEGTFELVAAGLPRAPLSVLVSPRGKYLLPLQATLDLLGIPVVLQRDSAVARVARPAGIGTATLRWRGDARGIAVTSLVPLDTDDVVVLAEAVYLSAPRFALLVEGEVDVDLATLTVRAERQTRFPAQIRLDAQARRREDLRRADAERGPAHPEVPFVPRTGLGVAEWAVGGSITPVQLPSVVETRLGLGVWGGMLKTRGALSRTGSGTAFDSRAGEASWHRVFPGARWVRQVQVGDVFSEGALARPIRGLTLTNAPFSRRLRFGDLAFSRPLPPGWEYEVYEGDRLVGYADASTRTPLNIPLQYGTTPLRVRLLGPAGEIIESAVSYVIPIEQLPGGETQYAVGGGRCAERLCERLVYGEVRRGVTTRLTVQAGLDEIADSLRSTVRPYGAVSYLPAPTWAAAVQVRRDAYARATLQNVGTGRVTGSASLGVNAPGEGGTAIARDSTSVWFASGALNVLGVPAVRSVSLSTRIEQARGDAPGRWDLRATSPLPYGLIEVGVQSDPLAALPDSARTHGGALFTVAPTVTIASGRLVGLGVPVLRTEVGFQGGALAQWDIALSLQHGRGFANLALRRLPGLAGTQASIGGSVSLRAARLLTRLASQGGRRSGSYSVDGSVAFGGLRRAEALRYGGLGLAGVEGRVFRDVDGDGRFGAGDVPADSVTVQVGGVRATTDARGTYAVWSVLPYEVIDVNVDSLTLEQPGWMPAVATRLLRPSPHQFARVDFPLVQTREVIGTVTSPPQMPQPAGVSLELRDVATGVLYRARTFSDGGFYISRVRPGRYLLTVAASSLRAIGAADLPAREVVVGAESGEVVELGPIVLVPAGR